MRMNSARQANEPSQPAFSPIAAPDGAASADHAQSSMSERERLIAEAAYYRYQGRNGSPGDPIQDWLDAEAEFERSKKP
jgi:hypothetical protein